MPTNIYTFFSRFWVDSAKYCRRENVHLYIAYIDFSTTPQHKITNFD